MSGKFGRADNLISFIGTAYGPDAFIREIIDYCADLCGIGNDFIIVFYSADITGLGADCDFISDGKSTVFFINMFVFFIEGKVNSGGGNFFPTGSFGEILVFSVILIKRNKNKYFISGFESFLVKASDC
jgi:hypothetical protein